MYKKRNVAYVKPQEPSFLTKLKKEAGYIPGPDINTKREQLSFDSDSDGEIPTDENPTVVVLNPGDLTAEEAAKIENDKKLEEANAPADLSKKVIFQKPNNLKRVNEENSDHQESNEKKKQKKNVTKQLLSFDQEEEEEDECGH